MPPPRPKVPPYLLMLVVSFALVGLIGYQTLKDRKISSDLLLENTTLKELLKEEKKKASELHKKFTKLSTQTEELTGLKEGLSGQLIELDRVKSLSEAGKKKLETSLEERENEIKDLKDKLALCHEKEEELKLTKKEIVQKDAEISDLRARTKAMGKHSNEGLDTESTNRSESTVKGDEEKHDKKDLGDEDETSSGKGFTEREKKPSDAEETEGAKAGNEHTEEHSNVSKKKSHLQSMDNEDEESKVDDREETLSNEDTGEEADADKTHDEEEREKIHEEEETDEQPDIDMDVVNKADLEDNEIAAME